MMSATTTQSNEEINRQVKRSIGDLLAIANALGRADIEGTPRKITFAAPSMAAAWPARASKTAGPSGTASEG